MESDLYEVRRVLVGRRMSQTKPGGLLRREIPVVVGRWRDLDTPGYLEIDLVSHSGEVAGGEWIWPLCATDLCTGWTERMTVMGKGQTGIVAALEHIQRQLPFPLLGLHPDNGSEFINWHLLRWCQQTGILLFRSRPEHKNDNCHVEQKNWTLVCCLIGYQRLATPAQLEWLGSLYSDLLQSGAWKQTTRADALRERLRPTSMGSLPASSGKTTGQHRLIRGGDRQALPGPRARGFRPVNGYLLGPKPPPRNSHKVWIHRTPLTPPLTKNSGYTLLGSKFLLPGLASAFQMTAPAATSDRDRPYLAPATIPHNVRQTPHLRKGLPGSAANPNRTRPVTEL